MRLIHFSKRVLLAGVLTGIGLCWFAGLSDLISYFVDPPATEELPWSGFGDFVQAPDGLIYISAFGYLEYCVTTRVVNS